MNWDRFKEPDRELHRREPELEPDDERIYGKPNIDSEAAEVFQQAVQKISVQQHNTEKQKGSSETIRSIPE